jgi:hypothetical protein
MEQFDLVTAIERQMLAFYMDREFGLPVPVESTRKEVQTIKKLVDN